MYANSTVCFETARLEPDPHQVREARDEGFLYEAPASVEDEEDDFGI